MQPRESFYYFDGSRMRSGADPYANWEPTWDYSYMYTDPPEPPEIDGWVHLPTGTWAQYPGGPLQGRA